MKSLWELALSCMKTWILFLTRFNYSHQKKTNFPQKSKDTFCSLFVNMAQIPSQFEGWMACSDKCLIKLTKVNVLHVSLGWPCKIYSWPQWGAGAQNKNYLFDLRQASAGDHVTALTIHFESNTNSPRKRQERSCIYEQFTRGIRFRWTMSSIGLCLIGLYFLK